MPPAHIQMKSLDYDAISSVANELRILIESANAPIFGIDSDGNVNEWNNKTAEITGYSKEEAMNKPLVTTFIVDSLRSSVSTVLKNALEGIETSNYELEFLTKAKEIRHLLLNATTRRNPEGKIVGVVGVAQDVTDAKKHELSVTALANELVQLVNTANAPIFGIDKEGRINEWNETIANITGFTKEEALMKPLISFIVVLGQREAMQQVRDDCLKGVEKSNYEVQFQTKDGKARHLLVNFSTRRDIKGEIVGVLGLAQDITESKEHELAVSIMADELRQLIETANAPIFGIDIHGNVNEWNNKCVEITGFSKEEAMNKPLVETFIKEKMKESVQEVLNNALKGKETSNYETEFRTKFKGIRCLLVNATTRRDTNNNIAGVVGVGQDVTDAKKNDRAILAMGNELRQFIDSANAPIFGIDVNGNVNEWNNKTSEITGICKKEAIGAPLVATYIAPDFRESVDEVLNNALKGEETSNYELEFITASKEKRYLLVNATSRRDPEGVIIGVVGVAQDVTEAVTRDRSVAAMMNELRQLIDKANAPIFGVNVHGNINEWNDKTAEITGFTKEEAMNKPLVSTFIVGYLRQSVQDIFDDALKGNETSNCSIEFVTKAGGVRYLFFNATTRRDADDNVVGVVGVAQDATDVLKRDRAVVCMARELRMLIDTANAPIFGIDVDGNVNEWNDKTAEITGFSKGEALNQPFVSTFVVPSYRYSVQLVLDNALRGIQTSNYELEFHTKNHEIRYLLVNATSRRDSDNKIIGVVGVAQDVTEAKKHDRAVALMAKELRQLIETANAPIFGIDKDGCLNEWNNKIVEITGFSKEYAIGKDFVKNFVVTTSMASVQDVLEKALQGQETSNYEIKIETKSNDVRFLSVNATTRRDVSNHVIGVVGVAQDVTEDHKHSFLPIFGGM